MFTHRVRSFHVVLTLCLMVPGVFLEQAQAQEPALTAAAIEQSRQQPVPTLVPFQGMLPSHASEKLLVRFSIFASENSREPLWSEQQMIQLGRKGEYNVLLGAGSVIGLPQTLFVAGEPRWVAVRIGEGEEMRSLLTSVPYAMKSADADSLGGLPSSSFVTREELTARLRSSAAALTAQAVASAESARPFATPTGGGTAGSVALWTSATALGNAAIIQTGTGTAAKVGITTTTPIATLDVAGTLNIRGNAKLATGVAATAAQAINSPTLLLGASSYSNGTSLAVAQNYAWQVLALGNNTATPSSKMALLFSAGTAAPAATGLAIAPTGIITFAPKQSFPGTIAGVTAGTGLKGGGITGTVTLAVDTTKIPQLGSYNAFTAGASFLSAANSPATLTAKNTGAGDGIDVATGTGFAGYFSNNAVYDATVYAINAGNGNAGSFNNNSATRVALAAFNASTDGLAIGVYGNVANGRGVYGISAAGAGVYGISTSGYGVYGTSTSGSAGTFVNLSATQPSLYGNNGSSDARATGIYGSASNGKGVYGFSSVGTGVYGGAATGYGGYFLNAATYAATVYAVNNGNGNAGSFNNNSASRVALAGTNTSTDPAAVATYGNVSNGKAVYGVATAGTGVYGTSTGGTGVIGKSQSAYGVAGYSQTGIGMLGELGFPSTELGNVQAKAGVWGDAGDSTSYTPIGVIGTADDGGGAFFGNNSKNYVTLDIYNASGGSTHNFFKTFMASTPDGACGVGGGGDLTCTGQVKAIVTTAGARQMETYSVQSSENWLEDYGSGTLAGGRAVIRLDRDFVEMANTGISYHVFLTPKGDANSLFITNETAEGFEVRESGHGSASISFDYRIVAKRRGLELQRMVDVTTRLRTEIESGRSRRQSILTTP